MNRKYLPSKQFVKRIVAIVIIIAIVFGIYEVIIFFKNRTNSTNQGPTKLIVKDIIQKDSNNNGIADWEESLWGFNPLTNGPENKEAILAKKHELTASNELTNPDGSKKIVNANENLSREFFALVMSLQQSGDLNETSLKSAADAFGSQIKPTPIPDTYTSKDQIIKVSTKKEDIISYFKSVNALQLKHKDLGTEISLISQGTENSDSTAYNVVNDIATSYISFSKELIKIPVPNKIAQIMLSMANNYEKLGETTRGLSKGHDDPIVAMKSLINYKNYNDALLTDTNNLSQNI